MVASIRRLRILLSSPGNLSGDREIVRKVVDHINSDAGGREGFFVEVVGWETHTRPAAGAYPQGVINDQLPEDIDIFLGMMGSYFGTPTSKWGSGTEEEYRLAYERWTDTGSPEIMFYFSEALPSSLSDIDPEQLAKRRDFQKDIGDAGVLYHTYDTTASLETGLYRHINRAVHEVLKTRIDSEGTHIAPDQSVQSLPNYAELLISDPSVAADDLVEVASDHLNEHTEETELLTKDIEKLLRSLNKNTKALLNANRQSSMQGATNAAAGILDSLAQYSKCLRTRIPILRHRFQDSITHLQRALELGRANALGEDFSLDVVLNPMLELKSSLSDVSSAISGTNSSLADWDDGIEFLRRPKARIIALHKDLDEYLARSIALIDELIDAYG